MDGPGHSSIDDGYGSISIVKLRPASRVTSTVVVPPRGTSPIGRSSTWMARVLHQCGD
jgi:hypothetical protein